MITCWSVKGGSGTSVISAMLAVACSGHRNTLLVDADGDQRAIFGINVQGDGFADWWQAPPSVGADALERLSTPVLPTLRLVHGEPEGSTGLTTYRTLDASAFDDATVVDAGTLRSSDLPAAALVESSRTSLLVLRPCYLAARRATHVDLRVDGLVVVEERGRSLRVDDLEDVLGVPVVATVPWDAGIARVVDSGRLAARLPRAAASIERLANSLLLADSGAR